MVLCFVRKQKSHRRLNSFSVCKMKSPSVSPSISPSFSPSHPSSTSTVDPTYFPSISPHGCHSASSCANYWDETAKLSASDGAKHDEFGYSVSLTGNIALVGARGDDDNGSNSGSVYVYEKDNKTGFWNETAKLTPSDGAAGDLFGFSTSASGNIAIVGARGDDDKGLSSGSVYVYEKDNTTGFWNETAKLTASDGASSDYFGWSVSISGNIVIAGAYGDDDKGSYSGSAYVYEKDATTGVWIETAKLTASDGAQHDTFGRVVTVSSNIALVGSPYSDGDMGPYSGSVYVYEKDDTTGVWNETAKLTPSDGAGGDFFGFSVSIAGHIALVGAYGKTKLSGSGAVYVYEKDDTSGFWNETAKLTASDEAVFYFGSSVSISGHIALVGTQSSTRSVYVYEKDDSTGYWTEAAKLTSSNGSADDNFGFSVSNSGDIAIVSAFHDDGKGENSGSAYVFEGA